jgi:hypothetical protein
MDNKKRKELEERKKANAAVANAGPRKTPGDAPKEQEMGALDKILANLATTVIFQTKLMINLSGWQRSQNHCQKASKKKREV